MGAANSHIHFLDELKVGFGHLKAGVLLHVNKWCQWKGSAGIELFAIC